MLADNARRDKNTIQCDVMLITAGLSQPYDVIYASRGAINHIQCHMECVSLGIIVENTNYVPAAAL